jgi:hypothetical protein
VTTWDPWGNLPNLLNEAPSRTMMPGEEPMPHQVTQGPKAIGIDPASAGGHHRRDLQTWLAVFAHRRTAHAISGLEPRYGAVRAKAPRKMPAEALGAVPVLGLGSPPWDDEGGDLSWVTKD